MIDSSVQAGHTPDSNAFAHPPVTMEADQYMYDPTTLSGVDLNQHDHDSTLHMFFDSTLDAQRLTEDLDWMFSGWPNDVDVALNSGVDAAAAPLTTSPQSINSYHSRVEDTTSTVVDIWPEVRTKLRETLDAVPAYHQTYILESAFFESNNLHSFHDLYFVSFPVNDVHNNPNYFS